METMTLIAFAAGVLVTVTVSGVAVRMTLRVANKRRAYRNETPDLLDEEGYNQLLREFDEIFMKLDELANIGVPSAKVKEGIKKSKNTLKETTA